MYLVSKPDQALAAMLLEVVNSQLDKTLKCEMFNFETLTFRLVRFQVELEHLGTCVEEKCWQTKEFFDLPLH